MFRFITKEQHYVSNPNQKPDQIKLINRLTKLFFTLFFLAATITLNATVYYVSNSGNDSNSGTTTDSSWKTLSKVNGFSFKPGDQVLFKKGDEWIGTITVSAAGTSGTPVVYGAYGTGEKPKIYGSEKISGWTKHSGNIYKASFSKPINQLFIEDNRMKAARHPNSGFMFISSTSGSSTLTANDLDGSINYSGAKWFGRTNYFTAALMDVKSSSSKSITLNETPRFPLKAGLGFFLMNKLEFLDQPGEWYYDEKSKTVYLWTEKGDSPDNYTIRGSVHKNGFYLSNKDNVTIKDINILQQSEKGIYLHNSDHVVIDNNQFSYADGFAIYSITEATNISITNNSIEGVNHYGMYIRISNSLISDNNLSKIALFDNIGITGTGPDNFGGGMYIAGRDGNNKVRYNRLTEIGYSGILFGKTNNVIEYNFVKDVCLLKSDMGGIYTSWFNRSTPEGTSGTIIRNNIVLNVKGEKYGYTSTRHLGEGIYIDESAKDVIVENNTIAHVTNSGIKLHKNENSLIRNNTILDARQAIHVLHTSGGGKSRISNNILVAASDKDDYLDRQVLINESVRNAICNDNIYVNSYASDGIFRSGSTYHSFNAWKSATGQDSKSTAYTARIQSDEKETLFYNDTKQDKTIQLGSKVYKDFDGKKVTGSFVLKPFTSRILIATNGQSEAVNQKPLIQNQSFEINDEKMANDFIGKVVASDPDTDQTLRFSIVAGNTEELFTINSVTGDLTARKNIKTTSNKTITLVVEVKDNATSPLSEKADISIYIKATQQIPISDVIAPVISSFSLPATASSLTVPVTFKATDNNGVTAWLIKESAGTPSTSDAGWKKSTPAEFTFSSQGSKTCYAWAKDDAGNISAVASSTVKIILENNEAPNPGDSIEYVTICAGEDYYGWTGSGVYERIEKEQDIKQSRGKNLIKEGAFSKGTTGWSIWGASGYKMSMKSNTSDYKSGPGSLQLTSSSTGSSVSSLQLISSNNISVEAGKEYELTFYAKATSDIELKKFVLLQRVAPYTHYGNFENVTPKIEKEWKQIKIKFKATASAVDGSFRIYLGNTLPVGQSVYFDDFVLAETTEETVETSKVITVHLTVEDQKYETEMISIWPNEDYNGWTIPGNYERILTSSSGCDSVVVTTLIVRGKSAQQHHKIATTPGESSNRGGDGLWPDAVAANACKVYPNPATTFINVDYSTMPDENTRIEIIDGTGRIVYAQEIISMNNRIVFDNLNPGMYYLRSVSGDSQSVEKFIID